RFAGFLDLAAIRELHRLERRPVLFLTGRNAGATRCAIREKPVDRVEDVALVFRFVHGLAQIRAAVDAVREPGGELLHFAKRAVADLLLDETGEVVLHHAVAVELRGRFIFADTSFRNARIVLRDLAEDPRVRWRGATDHHRVAIRFRDHERGV